MRKAQAPLQIFKPVFPKLPLGSFVTGQATLEFTLIFVIIIALLASLFVMWQWSMGNMVTRQKLYSSQRPQAGSTDTPGEPLAQEKVKALADQDMVYPDN